MKGFCCQKKGGSEEGGKKIKIWSVYNNGKSNKIWEILDKEELIGEGEIIVGGDFNIRIGTEGKNFNVCEDIGVDIRNSKDKILGNRARKMIDFIENKGWIILNGRTIGDEEGEFTFIGPRGSSVIDYIIVNEKMRERISKFIVEERADSDHVPVCATVRFKKKGRMPRKYTGDKRRERRRRKRNNVMERRRYK